VSLSTNSSGMFEFMCAGYGKKLGRLVRVGEVVVGLHHELNLGKEKCNRAQDAKEKQAMHVT
jgi:hypothetical protein